MTTAVLAPVAAVRNLSVSIAVRNLDETAAWYRDNLGFEMVQHREFPEYKTRIAFLEVNNCRIELIEDQRWQPARRPDPPYHTGIQGVSQIAFRVEDMNAVIEQVKQRPITVAWELITVNDLGMKEFFIRDNEGNLLQFIQTF